MDKELIGKKVIIVGYGNNSTIASQKLKDLGCEVLIAETSKDIPEGFNEDLLIEASEIPNQIEVPPLPFKMQKIYNPNIETYFERPRSKYHK